jgi:hypothetical protein
LARSACKSSRIAVSRSVRPSCAKANNDCKCPIDVPKLTKREQPVGFAKLARIDGTELLDQDTRPLTVDFHLRPERSRLSARRGRRDDDRRQAEQFVRLNDYAETLSGLLVSSGSSRRPETKDFTPLHEGIPSNAPLEPSLRDPRGQRLAVSPQQRGHPAALA